MKSVETKEEAEEAFGKGTEVVCMASLAIDPNPNASWRERILAMEREIFDRATKIDAKDYTGWVSWSGVHARDRYFESVEDLRIYCKANGVPVPSFVWACIQERFRLDADWILDSALEDHHENARDHITGAEEARLQVFLDEWSKAQGIVSWHEDRTRAVVLT